MQEEQNTRKRQSEPKNCQERVQMALIPFKENKEKFKIEETFVKDSRNQRIINLKMNAEDSEETKSENKNYDSQILSDPPKYLKLDSISPINKEHDILRNPVHRVLSNSQMSCEDI